MIGHIHNVDYYTSEEFFLYETTVDRWTIQHFTLELLTALQFFNLCTPTTFQHVLWNPDIWLVWWRHSI